MLEVAAVEEEVLFVPEDAEEVFEEDVDEDFEVDVEEDFEEEALDVEVEVVFFEAEL